MQPRRRCWGRSESWKRPGRSWLRSDSNSTSFCPANCERTTTKHTPTHTGWLLLQCEGHTFVSVGQTSICVCVCVSVPSSDKFNKALKSAAHDCVQVTFSYSYNHSSVDSTTFCKEKAQFVVIWLQSWFLFFIFIVYLLECDAPQANQAATVCPEATVTFSFFYNCNSSAQPFKPQTWLYWHLSWYSLWTAAPNTFAHYSDECRPFSSGLAPWFLCESHRVLFVWVVFDTNMKAGFIVAHWCFLWPL